MLSKQLYLCQRLLMVRQNTTGFVTGFQKKVKKFLLGDFLSEERH